MAEHNAKILEMKKRGFDLAFSIARMSVEQRKMSGFESVEQVILTIAKDIEKRTVALERKYP